MTPAMRRLGLALLILLVARCGPQPANAQTPVCPGVQTGQFMRGLGNQTLTVSTVAVALTVPTGSVFATLTVGGADIRVTDDGTVVSATLSRPLANGSRALVCGRSLGAARMIRDAAAAGNATVYLTYYGP